ncbi:ABC transporter substrate-binding protein [Devosia ginsengisoli]|uniref:ABC transporter substrate-binding protein n=1 Tax=Devosia ginsengisoli TaxID=400770 RepID=UPI0026E9B638|nr:ABC transporter substrate-binding protein [Devosia ginsengisoli]MCR6670925.1 ABC transporter substrate-binding protein [Devosia ginsengisoli]
MGAARPRRADAGRTPNIEEILALEPDLIICPTTDPDSEWWPLNKLKSVAPILPTDYLATWQDNLANLAAWLDLPVVGAETIGQYNGLIADIRVRHAAAIAGRKVAAVQLDASKNAVHVRTLGTSYGQVMPGQVLAEIGGLAVPADILSESGEVGIEQVGDLLDDVEGFLILDFENGAVEAFADNPLWNRLPAVAAGHTHVLKGNSTFGSLYTALYLAGGWDEVYKTLA